MLQPVRVSASFRPILERHDESGVERVAAEFRRFTSQHHAHPEYQLTLGLQGVGSMEYLGGRARIPPGCMAIFHPAEPHVIANAERARPWKVRVLHIPPRWLEAHGKPLLQPAPLLVDPALARAFEAVWSSFVARKKAGIETPLLELGALLAARPGLELPGRPGSELLARSLSFLTARLDRPVSMRELSQGLRVSSERIRRAVSAATGLSPLSWHLQRRIEESKHLLLRGESISATALRAGFADQAHFTRHFKRLVGVSPARYVRGARGARDAL